MLYNIANIFLLIRIVLSFYYIKPRDDDVAWSVWLQIVELLNVIRDDLIVVSQ